MAFSGYSGGSGLTTGSGSRAARTRAAGATMRRGKVLVEAKGVIPVKTARGTKSRPSTGGAGSTNGRGSASGTRSKSSTTTSTPATPTVQPFLTPAQQLALNGWNTRYGTELANLQQADVSGLARFTQTISADTLRNTQATDITNQNMAARGLFESSIRDGALNDLATTLATQENLATTNYHAILLHDQTNRNALAGQNAAQQAYYDALAVQNAQNQPPDVNPSGTPGSTGGQNTGSSTGSSKPAQTGGNPSAGGGQKPLGFNPNTMAWGARGPASMRAWAARQRAGLGNPVRTSGGVGIGPGKVGVPGVGTASGGG